jgi:hypothetical protein
MGLQTTFLLPAALLVVTSTVLPAGGEEGVLLLNGFEPEVLREWAARRKASRSSYLCIFRIGEDGLPCAGGMRGRLVKGDATEGRYALVRAIPRTGGKRRDHSLNYLRKGAKESIRRRAGLLLSTFGAFRLYYPQDWSAYAKLRIDTKSDSAPLRLRVEIEDSVIVPPVRRTYETPAGRWVTVEVNLADAAGGRFVRIPVEQPDE